MLMLQCFALTSMHEIERKDEDFKISKSLWKNRKEIKVCYIFENLESIIDIISFISILPSLYDVPLSKHH